LAWVETMPFSNDTFDKALAINSMQVSPDAAAGLREILRVLKSGAPISSPSTFLRSQVGRR
jgi:ubiquinone/menaquinone biosynthesis C-methylase UbiE